MRSRWAAARADSAGIPSLNSRDAETGGAASESGCSISTLFLYQGESQNLVNTQMWCGTVITICDPSSLLPACKA